MAALVCACKGLDTVGQWGRDQRAMLEGVFGLRRELLVVEWTC